MNKIERVRAAVAGRPLDYPPFTLWCHFGTQCAPPEVAARMHLEFLRGYDLDLLKVMHDYEYPMPAGLETIATPADLARIAPLDVTRGPMGKELEVLEILRRELSGEALFLESLFDPWNVCRRSLLKEALPAAMAEQPRHLERALQVVSDNLIRYALAALERGVAGFFLAVHASPESVTREQYERFMRPYHLQLFEALAGQGEFHALHAHGDRVYFDRLLDYPIQILSWDDRNAGPSIPEMRARTPLTLMAGLDHKRFHTLSAAALAREVREVRAQAGPTKFILAPGCVVETWTQAPFIRAAREAARR